ncbi:MAG: hypothetical protein ACLPWO_05485 [Thermoplasmata archaeon]
MSAPPTAVPPPPPPATYPMGVGAPIPPPPPPKRTTKRMIQVVVAVVVVAIVLLALVLAGIIPLGTNGNGTTVVAQSSSDALTAANAFANGISGGPWYPSQIAGIDLTTSYSNHTTPTPPAGCTVQNFSGISVPAYDGNYSNGKLGTWAVVYTNARATAELYLLVQNGQAKEVELIGGATCSLGTAKLPNAFISSTDAAAAALTSSNVSAFVRSHTSASAEFVLFSPGELGSGLFFAWIIGYSTCDIENPSGGPTQGSLAYGVVNATTGALMASAYEAAQNCTLPLSIGTGHGSTPIGSAFAVGNPIFSTCAAGATFAANGCLAGDFTYALTIEASAVTFGDVLFEVSTAVGTIYTLAGPGGFSVEGITGTVEASYAVGASSLLVMTTGFTYFGSGVSPSTPLTSVDTILIDMGTVNTAGMGLTFTVLGTGSFSGTTAPLSLP